MKEGENSGELEEGLVFQGLDAVMDLQGNLLGSGARSKASCGSNGG